MARVVLAMSGGVDSSVAAHLLRRDGHEVIGLFMRHGEAEPTACSVEAGSTAKKPAPQFDLLPILKEHKQGCCSASDAADARRVADRLDIPFYAIDFHDDFGRIQDYFVEEYTSGRTPNPCVMCNNWLKFGKLCEYADGVGADFVATGHYARLRHDAGPSGVPSLVRGVDDSKDQTYVLFGIEREILKRVLFPVGDYHKDEIREMAREVGLRVADKKDSQEICFVPNNDYASFVRDYVGGDLDLAGEIVTTDGRTVGRHAGIEHFTIGQRKGLNLAFGEPRYVVRIEADTKRVVIGTQDELLRTELTAKNANWLIEPPRASLECQVKIRYKNQPVAATVSPLEGGRLHVVMHEPRAGVAPGQAVVCYDGDRVLGGGWIE